MKTVGEFWGVSTKKSIDSLLLSATLILVFQLWNFSRHTADISKKMDEMIKMMKTIKIVK